MIAGTLDNWRQHLAGPVWEKAFDYLAALTPDSPEEKTALDGDALFGVVMSYPTREVQDAVLETHRKYIDIQMVLVGAEGIDWFSRAGLEEKTPYEPETDVAFYQHPDGVAPHHLAMQPGRFVVLYPEDAHRPQLNVGTPSVKKVVVKVSVDSVKESA